MHRGANLFWAGIALICAELIVMFVLPNAADYAKRGLGLATPFGIALCIYSGVYGRRARRRDAAGGVPDGGEGARA